MISIAELAAKGKGLFASKAQGVKADAAMPGTAAALQAVFNGGTAAEKSAFQSSVSGAANLLTHRQRLLSKPWLMSQWTPSALGGTITSAADTADGSYAGGEIVTMTQNTTAGPKNTIQTSDRIYVPAIGNSDPWFATFEFKAAAGQFATITATDGTATNLYYIQIGLPDNQFTLKCAGGVDIVVTPTNFSQANWWRFTSVITPATATTGTVRHYLYWTDTVSNTEVRQYLGSQTYNTNAIVTRFIITQSWIATGVVQFARLIVAELYAVTNGCSVDSGYVGWCNSPQTARLFAPNSYNYMRNPAYLLGQLVAGNSDWYLNNARGGHTVADMSGEFNNFVLALSPRLISIGSATNSVNNAVALGTDVATVAQLNADKALYLAMCQQAVASGAIVIATEIAPRHDTIANANLGRWAGYAQDWNAWLHTTIKPLGVRIAKVWSLLNDASTPNRLAAWADAGDHVHFSWAGQRAVSESQFKALMGTN